MSQHTPGPWGTQEGADGYDDAILIVHGKIVQGKPATGYIAHITLGDDYLTDKAIANARLIAAAPEMLDFISTDLMNFWPDKVQAHPDVKILLAKARALLARIEGEK